MNHIKMHKILSIFSLLVSLNTSAQNNVLLEQAFWKNSPDITSVRAAVEKGANPAQLNGASFDPVVLAINAQAPPETIKYLLSQPGNEVTKMTHDNRTYLHWAANRGNLEIVKFLVAKGAKADIVDSHGVTPLNFAAGSGQLDTRIYDICITGGANLRGDLNHDGANALLLAVAADKEFKLTDYFVSKGLDLKSVDAAGNNIFAYAARSGNVELLKRIQQKGVRATDHAMIMAAQGSRGSANTLEVYEYLESLKLKPNFVAKNGENVLHSIARKPKQEEIIRHFILKGVDVNKTDDEGNTPWMNAAAVNKDTAVFKSLMPGVKNINQGNLKGITALAMAVRTNSPAIVSYIVARGASVNVVDGNGDGIGFYLIQSFSPQRMDDFDAKLQVLRNHGLRIDGQQKNGNTLYHIAAAKNELELLKRLESYHIDVNAVNSEGLTALHKAAMVSKSDSVIRYLLSIGANKQIKTAFGETAFDLAKENETLSKNNTAIDILK